jgi:hypothetical protein
VISAAPEALAVPTIRNAANMYNINPLFDAMLSSLLYLIIYFNYFYVFLFFEMRFGRRCIVTLFSFHLNNLDNIKRQNETSSEYNMKHG